MCICGLNTTQPTFIVLINSIIRISFIDIKLFQFMGLILYESNSLLYVICYYSNYYDCVIII